MTVEMDALLAALDLEIAARESALLGYSKIVTDEMRIAAILKLRQRVTSNAMTQKIGGIAVRVVSEEDEQRLAAIERLLATVKANAAAKPVSASPVASPPPPVREPAPEPPPALPAVERTSDASAGPVEPVPYPTIPGSEYQPPPDDEAVSGRRIWLEPPPPPSVPKPRAGTPPRSFRRKTQYELDTAELQRLADKKRLPGILADELVEDLGGRGMGYVQSLMHPDETVKEFVQRKKRAQWAIDAAKSQFRKNEPGPTAKWLMCIK